MAIDKKLICFRKLEDFETQLAAGNILDYSIVFIQDAKKIYNRGTYYDCSGSDVDLSQYVDRNAYLMPNNGFSADSYFGISYLKNALYAAEKRFEVTCSGFSSGEPKNLFDGSYEASYDISQGQTGTINISNYGNNIIEGYPYGRLYLSFYFENTPEAISARVYCNYAAQGIGWHDLPLIEVKGNQGGIYCFDNEYYDVTQVEFTITAKSDINTALTEIDWNLNRGDLLNFPIVSKFAIPQILHGDYTFDGKVTLGEDVNLKTINGESIVGSGNIEISGGSSSGGSGAYSEVNHGTADTTFTLTPNTFHVWDEATSLILDFGSETSGVANEFLFQFTSGAIATSLTLPDDIKWVNDSAPTIAENMIYQISVLKGLASYLEFSNINLILFTVSKKSKYTYQAEEGMTWGEWIESAYNVDGYYVSSNIVRIDGMYRVVSYDENGNMNYSGITPTTTIIGGYTYGAYYDD